LEQNNKLDQHMNISNDMVQSLLSPSAVNITLFGAKAANLARAAQLGFVVPDGLVISRTCTENEFACIAQKIVDEISLPVAVRSSATKEDSTTNAFPGMFDTFLGVNSIVDLSTAFDAVKNSGVSDRVKKYHGEAISSEHIAVIIQHMVNATRAGVAFSRDPNTGEAKVIIESNYGLGKTVVDGEITPDSIEYISENDYSTFVGRKSVQIMLADSGVSTQATSLADSQRSSLSHEEIKEIADLAQKVERDLGFAADIEWAFDSDGVLWLLQARPITTLYLKTKGEKEMSRLSSLPKPPTGVAYALTVPQSVLFADLSLRGSFPTVFRKVFGVDYAPRYIVVDDGAMWWDFSDSDPFNQLLSPKLKPDEVAQKFITVTARTARKLVRTAQIVSCPSRWRKSHLGKDLLEDLNAFWDAYEEHMASLYTFWNVENLLTDSLVEGLANDGFRAEIDAGLPTFVNPSEPNWFALEQQNLAKLKSRFANSLEKETTLDAASRHANLFGFLLAPFNLGTPPTGKDVINRMTQLNTSTSIQSGVKQLDGLSENLVRLGELERELTFWKTERLDAFALADQYAAPMYEALSDLLELPFNLMFSMTRSELTSAINDGGNVQTETLKQRSERYCLALIDGSINFYQPTDSNAQRDYGVAKSGDVLRGLPTSPGVVRGRVRIISPREENPVLASDEIIVTKMTRPELGVALDVALAYVTDEGGRLCHAAIVSREKKKPCVVALGNATEVLRPGMLIDVDGTAGTVTVVDASFLAN